ncbi:MAG: hypothetical protein EOP45_05965 [Sphingobacteriaceae bacterium]|nr:MAG: hypothetical protein EOP45_05965 [Sphingobacteriaceae bacterium]
MKLHRRKFLKISSITIAGIPLSKVTANRSWYQDLAAQPIADDLYEAFKNPTGTARPFVRWWWNGLRIVKEELLRELDMLKAAGIGGVEINSIRFPETADPLNYKEFEWLSDEWMEMVKVALKGAKERGLVCDIIMGSGWPFGGEFLKKDEQTQIMALGTRNLTGPQSFKIKRSELLDAVEPPISSKSNKKYKELSVLRLSPAMLQSLDTAVNLDNKINDELITFNVPEGEHVLYFLVKITGFMAVIYGAPGASGPVLNHYNKKAVELYLNKMSDAIKAKIGSIGANFRSVFTDSLELEGANWCDDMLEEFNRRRSYSLLPYIPFILFKTGRLGRSLNEIYGAKFSVGLQETLDRVRYDFEITKMELFQERFLDTFLTWCKQNSILSRVQAYGREYHPSDSSMKVDIPECETWIRTHIGEDLKENDYQQGRAYSEVNKFVSSGARLAGKRLISCEEITNTQLVFNATLEKIKLTGDQCNLSGVTHTIFHGFNYSPADAPFPGWVRYGTFFNERNPIYPFFKLWIAYKARLSAVFQNSDLCSDIAIMHPLPDLWSKYGAQWDPFPERAYPVYVHNIWEAIHQNGSGCDYVSEYIMQNATFPNGKLTYGPRSYKLLMVIEAESLHPETANAISRYAEAGGLVIFVGKEPHKSPGLNNHETQDKQVLETINLTRKKHPANAFVYPAPNLEGKIIDWYKEMQEKLAIKPYIKIDHPHSSVSQVYYKRNDADFFFISNYSQNNRFEFNAEFNVEGDKTAWIWNPETGKRFLYPTNGANNKLQIALGPAESKLIVFDKNTKGEKFVFAKPDKQAAVTLTTPWKVTLKHINGTQRVITLKSLVDFKEDADLKSFAGTVVYENALSKNNRKKLGYLNLGKVYGVSELIVNGENLGTRWYGDHLYNISGKLKKGNNSIMIKVTTTLGNYMSSLQTNKDAIKWVISRNQPLYSAGLIGPIQIQF